MACFNLAAPRAPGESRLRVAPATFLIVMIAAAALQVYAQGGATRYVYDDNGRLRAVIAPTGEANIYEYDPAGNITAIRRNTSTTLEVLGFSPREGAPGTQVTIVGTGFGGGVSAVGFNGVAAQVVSVNAPVLIAIVPIGATTGPISVTTPGGAAASAMPFVVSGISVAPVAATVLSDQVVEFSAVIHPAGSQGVVWSVDGIEGGSVTVGAISATGTYTAPRLPPNQSLRAFRIRAAGAVDASVNGEAVVTVKNPEFIIPAFAGAVSIRSGAPLSSNTIAANVSSGAISIRSGAPLSSNTIAANVSSGAVSILSGGAILSNAITANAHSRAVSIHSGGPSPLNIITSNVHGAAVLAVNGPVIFAIAPAQTQRGASTNITLTGSRFSGASTLLFIDPANRVIDPNITVSNIDVNGSGASLTATLAIAGAAALGRRIVVVIAAGIDSRMNDAGVNTIEVVP
ncbi:MAG: IPT/TIG domain-containing protein [Blastocatellia bacterium]